MGHLKNLYNMAKEHGFLSVLEFDIGITATKYTNHNLYHKMENLCKTKEGRDFYIRNMKTIKELFWSRAFKGDE